jgi:Hemerythrin HHE cation binding domain
LRTVDLSKREPELRAKDVSAFFEYRLINHMRLEEELLFPAFRAVLGVEASLIDLLLSDHRELRAKAVAIKAGAHDQVDSFCVLLERHIRTEERQLFVLAENRMKPAEMGQQIKAQLIQLRWPTAQDVVEGELAGENALADLIERDALTAFVDFGERAVVAPRAARGPPAPG